MNGGGPIFREVLVVSIWWRIDTSRPGFRTARSEPRNRSTDSPQVINRASTIDLAEKANPHLRIEEHKQELEECNQDCRCMINLTSWGLTNRCTAKTVKYRLYLSKTQTLMVWRLLNIKRGGSCKTLWTHP